MKRTIAVLLCVLMLFTAMPVFAVSAEAATLTFTVGNVTGKPGDTVVVPVTVSGNPGIASAKVNVGYDADVLEVVSITAKDFTSATAIFATSPLTNNPITINWVDTTNPNGVTTTNGVFGEVTFKIKDTALEGSTALTQTIDPNDVYDWEFGNVPYNIVDGSVTVINPSKPVTGVALDQETLALEVGDSATLQAALTPADGTYDSIAWASDNAAVSVADGVVTANAEGTANVTVTVAVGEETYTATCAVTVSTPATVVETGTCGLDNNWTLDSNGHLEIVGKRAISSKAFLNRTDIVTVTMSGVTEIGGNAFQGCTNLVSISIPETVKKIGAVAFRGCTSLKTVVVPNTVTSIGMNAFYGCTGMENFTMSNTLTTLGKGAFAYCTSLKSIVIPGTLKTIDQTVFDNCTGMTSITIENGVTRIEAYAFRKCSSLESIVFPDSITYIGTFAFNDCGFKSMKLPENLTRINATIFRDCDQLKSVVFPVKVNYINTKAFYSCNGLETIAFSGNPKIQIAKEAFAHCISLQSISLPNNLENIGTNLFDGCLNLKSLYIPSTVTKIGDYSFRNCSSLETFIVPTSVTSIGRNAFSGCRALKVVAIHEGVTTMGAGVFNLAKQTLVLAAEGSVAANHATTNKVKTIAYTDYSQSAEGAWYVVDANGHLTVSGIGAIAADEFAGRDDILTADIDYGVTGIGAGAFDGCANLGLVTINGTVAEVGAGAFADCPSVNLSVTLNSAAQEYAEAEGINYYISVDSGKLTGGLLWELDHRGLLTITGKGAVQGSVFAGRADIVDVVLGEGVTAINGMVFKGCANLKSVDFPSTIRSIGIAAFADCTALETMVVPDTVTDLDDKVFQGCASLKSITLPSGLTEIGASMFEGCAALTALEIPAGVTSIGSAAFRGCTALTTLTVSKTVATIGAQAFGNCPNLVLKVEADSAALTYAQNNGIPYELPITDPSFVVGNALAGAGETVTIPVSIVNNPGIISAKVWVDYDSNVLELQSIESQDFTSGTFGTGPMTADPVAVNWIDPLNPNNTNDGVVAVLTFKVKDNAAAGRSAITVSYDAEDVFDYDYNNVTFATVAGGVTVG